MAKIPKKLCAFRLTETAILTIAKLAALRECSQSQAIEYALGLVQVDADAGFDSLTEKLIPRKLSRKARLAEQRKAADPIAQNLGREDIDYMNPDELPSAGSAGLAAVVKGAGTIQHVGTKSLPDWRAGRKPLPKPKDRGK